MYRKLTNALMCVAGIIGIMEDGETAGSGKDGSVDGVVAGRIEDGESVGWVADSTVTVDGAPMGKRKKK